MKKHRILAVMMVAALLFMVACAGGDGQSASPAAQPAASGASAPGAESTPGAGETDYSGFKVGFMAPDSITDIGWSKQGADAALLAADELGCTVSVIEAGTADVMKSEAEAFADDGYNLIIGHGSQYGSPFSEVCGDYPDVTFLTMGGSVRADNLHPIRNDMELGCFLEGVIAALTSESGMGGGIVSGEYINPLQAVAAFRAGAKFINPDFKVTTVALSSEDVNEAYEVTKSLIQQGADSFITDANSANIGVYNAAKEAGAYVGATGDPWFEQFPENCPATVIGNMDSAYLAIIKGVADGTMKANDRGYLIYGYTDGQWDLIYSEALKDVLPAEALTVKEDYLDQLISKEIFCPNVDDIEAGYIDAFKDMSYEEMKDAVESGMAEA